MRTICASSRQISAMTCKQFFMVRAIDQAVEDFPDNEEMEALQRFANVHGRTWKNDLRRAWETGNYNRAGEDGCFLQRVRNKAGPRWLNSRRNTIKPITTKEA